ncbi:origin recognition complex subunit 3-like [Procambarus clarkii]|uniref:origin recognition complex subunit 3-like n=1 Tax=Procambarus clarkii TaxID=6728 RepID=UPI0037431C34
MATVSVSKGVFSFKRSKGNKRKVCGISSLDYWSEVEDEDIKEVNYKNYVKCWQMVTNILNDLQSSIHAKVFEDLVKFVRNSGEESCTINASTTGGKSVEGQRDIPTACLVTGVNMSDHNAVFSSLVGLLVEGVTPHIAQLRSRECTTLRGAIHKMITQLMGQNDLVDLDFEDEMMKVPSIKRTQVNMAVLTSWYQLCMIQHFLGNSSAFLCCPASERASRIKAMPPAQLDVIHKLLSFRSYVESRPPKEQTALLLDEKTSKKLLEIAKKKNKRPNAYELLRSEVLQLLSNVFELHLQPVNKQPPHEILFFESSSSVKQHLVGMPRAPLTTALSNPHHYLQCECCQLEDPSSVVTTLPDVSVVYKLHLECGRLINLYDWLQAYISVADPEEDTSSKNAIDQRLQARFVQAVSEMQFLGFVKATSRKTDHVARLTWGGC